MIFPIQSFVYYKGVYHAKMPIENLVADLKPLDLNSKKRINAVVLD